MLALNHTASEFTCRWTSVVMLISHVYLPEMVFSTTRDEQIPVSPACPCWVYTLGKTCSTYKQSDNKWQCFSADEIWHGKTTNRKTKKPQSIFCKLCCKSPWTTCIFLCCLALHILSWPVVKNTENSLLGLLHQQMLIRATHNQSSSSLKWSFHLSPKCTWACFTIPTSHLFQWV